jgi:hypothetical protein
MLVGHDVTTVVRAGWAGLKNGVLLARMDGIYDVFITVDQSLPTQQNLKCRGFGVIVVRAPSNTLKALAPLTPMVLAALTRTSPGKAEVVAPADEPGRASR